MTLQLNQKFMQIRVKNGQNCLCFVNFFKDKSIIIPDFSDHSKPTVSKVPLAEVHFKKKGKLLSDNIKPREFYNIPHTW